MRPLADWTREDFERLDLYLNGKPVVATLAGAAARYVHAHGEEPRALEVAWPGPLILPREGLEISEVIPPRAEALYHPDWVVDALPMESVGGIEVRVMAPVDLAVSCLLRWNGWERQCLADLVEYRQADLDAVVARAREALSHCLGQPQRVLRNIEDARRMTASFAQAARPFDRHLHHRAQALVEGLEVDLEAPLSPGDE
jgi:hypothetical protein